MPVTLTHPGVYIQELPSGGRTITGVATAVTAFVGRALRGPVDEPVPVTSFADFERRFGGLWRESGLGYAVRDYYFNGGSQAIVVRLPGGEAGPAAAGDPDPEPASPARLVIPPSGAGTGTLTLEASSPGSWGDALTASVTPAHVADADAPAGETPAAAATRLAANAAAAGVAAAQGVAVEDLFHLELREGPAGSAELTETFSFVTVVDGPRRVTEVLATSQLARVSALPTTVPVAGEHNVDQADRGSDGSPLVVADDYVGEGFQDAKRGLYALLDADLFTILCLPPPQPDGDLPSSVWAMALAFCRDHRALLLVDTPSAGEGSTVDTVEAWLAAQALVADGRNGAVYFPRTRKPDPLRDGAVRAFAPSGTVAGIMARTDSARGVWKAPAGIEAGLSGATGLSVPLTDGENGRLNPIGINCLRTFPVIGSVVWGARTLRGADLLADEYKYVPVRRFALFLEETLFRGTQWVVFEPNDAPLWSQIRASIGAFMQDLFRQGAFQGQTPRDAYFVRCDAETTTQYDIDRGIVNIVVGFAPLKPAEFVVVSIQQKTAGAAA